MFGGGVSPDQLTWFRQQLSDAKQAEQQVLVFSHLPLHPDTCVGTCLLWNYEEILQAIWDSGNVVATMAGHAHKVSVMSATAAVLTMQDMLSNEDAFPANHTAVA